MRTRPSGGKGAGAPAVALVTWLLAASAAALCAMLLYALCVPYAPRENGAGGRAEPLSLAGTREQATAVDEQVFRRKKLFDGPDMAAGQEAPEPGNNAAGLRLMGVSFGERAMAMIRDGTGNKDFYVAEGDPCLGAVVKSIEKDRVLLQSGGKTLELRK